jgi:hypothetical protein
MHVVARDGSSNDLMRVENRVEFFGANALPSTKACLRSDMGVP